MAPAIWRWRWHWRWCCRPQQRSERGPGEARAQLCELHGRSRPPDCCPGSPWPTQIAQRSRRPSPQPKATSQGSTVQPGRAGHGRPGEEWALRGAHSRFRFALQTPIYTRCAPATTPALPRRRLRVHPRWATRRLVLRPRPPTRPRPSTRARCVRRAALGRRASNSAPPPSLGRAPILTHSSISKSGPRDLEFQYPVVVLNIELAKCQVGAPSQSSMTKRSFRHGFEFCTGWCRPSCSTWEF